MTQNLALLDGNSTYIHDLTQFPQNITSWGIEAAARIALRTILKTNSALKHSK